MTATTIRVQMAQRKDTAANWTAANPILLSGEIGYETDTKKFKIGDGTTNWNSLAYLPIPDGSGNLTITGNLEIGTTGSLTFEGSTANGFETTLAVTDPTADRTITLPNVSGTVVTTGDTGSITSTMIADGTIVNADISSSAEIAVSKLANGIANQVIVTDGTNVSWSDNLTLAGDLTVNGTTTTINTQDLLVEDKNIIIGNVATPSDVTADGGGITLKGAIDKTISWVDATDAWTSSERFSYPLGSATAPALTFTGDPNTGIYSPGADQVAISTNGLRSLLIEADGTIVAGRPDANTAGLEIGRDATASRAAYIDLVGDTTYTDYALRIIRENTGANANTIFYHRGTGSLAIGTQDAGSIKFFTNGTANERASIDASGRLLVGTSSARANFFNSTFGAQFQVEGTNGNASSASIVRNTADAGAPLLLFGKTRGTSLNANTVVANGDQLGYISFGGADGTEIVESAAVYAEIDGTPGANDMPGRLVFSTTADGASSPTERARITSGGYLKASNDGAYRGGVATFTHHDICNTANNVTLAILAKNASYTDTSLIVGCFTSASSAYSIAKYFSGDGATQAFQDIEFNLRGDGNAFADGSWTGGGADYAEYFEWSDGNPDADDRRGIAVVLDGDKIRPALAGEDPIGVISGNPSVVGDSAWNKWSGKYLRDDFGTYIQEDYEVEDEDGNTVIQQRRKLNPAYDPDVEYTSREERPEWDCVGLMGKLRIRKGQPTGSRWIKMRDISDFVEEWLVR